MSNLAKARAALTAANGLDVDLTAGMPLPPAYLRLIDIAQIQAEVAQADALDRIATAIENLSRRASFG